MADPRLNSCHFELLPRREEYRRARAALLGARGWLTLAAERVHGLADEVDDWPSLLPVRPEQILPGTQYFLVDDRAGCDYPLRTGLNTIGRLSSNDIVLKETVISRRHCVLLVHAWGGCELHDTASLNGTYVNDQRVCQPVRLVSGDWIKVCSRLLLFVSKNDCRGSLEDEDHPTTVVE